MEQQQQGYPPIGSVWEASRPIFSRRIVIDPKMVPGIPPNWVAFLGGDNGDDFAFTMATPLDGWNRWAKDATRVSAPDVSKSASFAVNLTLEARDAPELRRRLAEEVGKVIQLLGERDKAIQDRNEAIAERNAATRLADAIRSERDKAKASLQKIKEALTL